MADGGFESVFVAFSLVDGKKRAGAHAQPQKNRRQKGHERIGAADGRQRIAAQHASDHEGVRHIVKLL